MNTMAFAPAKGVAMPRKAFAGKAVAAKAAMGSRKAQAFTIRAVAADKKPAAAAAGSASGRVFNFSAGPAALYEDVIVEAQDDLLNWKGTGVSVLEMSHRGKEFMKIAAEAEADLRTLLKIPDNYKVLFMQGGASTQFSCIPLNFAEAGDTADYITTGSWSAKGVQEGKRLLKANEAATGKPGKFTAIPPVAEWNLSPDAKYVHICANETIQGVEFKEEPDTNGVPLIADMSSNFCSKPIDVSKYAMIYAGAQKNIGPSGCTFVIIREDFVGKAREGTPVMLDYATHADNDSMYNTPPCFAWYVCGLTFKKLLALGGLEKVNALNEEKAKVLYDAIEASDGFFKCPTAPECRSNMNVPFTTPSDELDALFIKEAAARGMVQLKGHRSIGGVRASIYNAMPKEGVEALAGLMKEFAAEHGGASN